MLKGWSPLLAYDFWHNLKIAFVISRLVLVAGPFFDLMNPKYLTGFPRASLHELDESMSVLRFEFEKDNLLSLINVCKTYILNTKPIQTKLYFRKSLRRWFWKIIINYCLWNSNNRSIFDHSQWLDWLIFWCLMPLSAIFKLNHGDQF